MKSKITLALLLIAMILLSTNLQAQVGIGTTAPNADAELDINSTTRGLLLPRLALTNTTSPAPLTTDVAGMVVYNTATAGDVTPGFYYNDGTDWIRLGSGGAASNDWTITGNAGTTAGTNFLGTTDNVALLVRTNNTNRITIQAGGNVGINDAGNATDQLSVTDTDYPINGYATGTATNHTALYGSQTGVGSVIWGENFKTTNDGTSAVFGEMENSHDPGVEGRNNEPSSGATSSVGVFGRYNVATGNKIGIGVSGYAFSVQGVTGYGIGVQGEGGDYGVYAIGDSGASGVKTFNIDHPLDPENKTLRHFSIESNEVLNMYRGTITFNASGEALVELPEYFNSINRNFSYQLTPIGQAMPNLYIKTKINNSGKFLIAGGVPNQEVSWTIHAERNDKYLQVNPNKRLSEIEKPDHYKGRYWDVRTWNQPREKGIIYMKSNLNLSRDKH